MEKGFAMRHAPIEQLNTKAGCERERNCNLFSAVARVQEFNLPPHSGIIYFRPKYWFLLFN